MKIVLKGLIAAVVTPTKPDGELNLDVIPSYVDYLLEQNVKGVFVNGTTGEWPSFSVNERKQVAESWIQHGRNKLDSIIIHCGTQSYKDAQELVRHAASIKADAVSCISPSVFKPTNQVEHVAYFKKVVEVAPDIPFMFYYLPGLTGINVDFREFLPLMCQEIKSFVGFKISSPHLFELSECLHFHKHQQPLNICYGVDEQLHSALLMGAESAVGSFYNFLGKEFNVILEYARGDITKAADLQRKVSIDFKSLLTTYGGSVNKVLTSVFSGIDMGPLRLPWKRYTEDEVQSIKSYLRERSYMLKE